MKKKRRKRRRLVFIVIALVVYVSLEKSTKQVINQQIIYICFRKPGFLFHLCWNYGFFRKRVINCIYYAFMEIIRKLKLRITNFTFKDYHIQNNL
jgi:hypothetical protein